MDLDLGTAAPEIASPGLDGTAGFSVGELAARTGVSIRSLRYYEQQGLLQPDRTSGGHRLFTDADERTVTQIQELLRAGFCSSVIRDLLPALASPGESHGLLRDALEAARARLESERDAIQEELRALAALRDRLGLAPDTRVSPQDERHVHSEHSEPPAAPFDHRDRRLR